MKAFGTLWDKSSVPKRTFNEQEHDSPKETGESNTPSSGEERHYITLPVVDKDQDGCHSLPRRYFSVQFIRFHALRLSR